MGALKVGRGTEPDSRRRPADRRHAARQGQRAGRRRRRPRRQGAGRRQRAATAPATSTSRPCSRRPRGRAPAGRGDLRPGRADRNVLLRRRGDRGRQRHRVRPRRLRLHARPQARHARDRGARDRHGRAQPGRRLQRRRAIRRCQAVGLRPRGRARGDRASTWRRSTSRWRCSGSPPRRPGACCFSVAEVVLVARCRRAASRHRRAACRRAPRRRWPAPFRTRGR